MKFAKGFKGRYFSLAAIVAVTGAVTLQAGQTRSEAHHNQIVYNHDEEFTDEETELEDLVVEAALPSQTKDSRLTSDISVLTSQELQNRQIKNALEAVRSLSSISIAQNGGMGQSSSFYLRGMNGEHALVLVDGIRYNDPTTTSGQAMLEQLSLENIKQIEIIKGAQSGVWGADAAAGVINIVTKRPEKGWHATLSAYGGGYMTQGGALQLSYADDAFELSAAVDGVKTEGFPSKAGGTQDDASILRTYMFKGKFHISEASHLQASFQQMSNRFEYDSYGTQVVGSIKDWLGNLQWQQRFDKGSVTLYANRSQFNREYSGNGYRGSDREFGIKGSVAYADVGRIDVGALTRTSRMDENYGEPVDYRAKNQALYLSNANWLMDDRLIFNASVRYDEYDIYSDKTTARAGLAFRWTSWLETSANVGSGYHTPTLYQRFGDGGVYVSANDGLKLESVISWDVGLKLLGLQVTYFDNRVKDLIDYGYDPETFAGQYVNVVGQSKIRGVEAALEHAFETVPLSLGAGYTYLDAKNAEQERLVRRPRHKVTAESTVWLTDNLAWNLNGEYAADWLDLHYDSATFVSSVVKKPPYLLLNTVLALHGEGDSRLFLKINNIGDVDYQLADGYNTEGQTVYVGMTLKY